MKKTFIVMSALAVLATSFTGCASTKQTSLQIAATKSI